MVGSLSDRTAELVFGVGRWMNPLYRAGRRLVSTTAFLHGMALTKNVDTHKAAAKFRNRGMVAFLEKGEGGYIRVGGWQQQQQLWGSKPCTYTSKFQQGDSIGSQ